MKIQITRIGNILTRCSGYLREITSHSVQPYRGCSFGRSLCGEGCYVRHNFFVTRGRPWGSFLEVRANAAASYREHYPREQRWARRVRGTMSLFLSSSTDPFVPQEFRFGITRQLLETMLELPPDLLILQTHSHRVTRYLPLYRRLGERCRLRVHISIEGDRDRLPGLPPPASSVTSRLAAASRLKRAGIRTVITVAPLLPMDNPHHFFQAAARAAHAIVIDHFLEGDGSRGGRRTLKTRLPESMGSVEACSLQAAYADRMIRIAEVYLPGCVGRGRAGFAGHYRPAPSEAGISAPG